jgi:MFS family permease
VGYAGILRQPNDRTLEAIGRIASAPPVSRPGESLPASAPALAAAPLFQPTARRSRATPSTLRASFRASYAEGAVAELFAACTGGTVLTAWALHLGATPLAIGLLGAMPLAAQVLHLPSALLTQLLGSKRVAVVAIAASRLVWLPLVALPFAPLTAEAEMRLFVAVVAIAAVLGVLGNNAWVAWMGDLIPEAIRGRFFSWRTIYITAAGTLASLAAGLALDAVTPRGGKLLMLAALAAVACLAGVMSAWLLLRQAPGRADERERPDLRALARAAVDPHTRPWLVYLFCWNAAVALSASFFAYHMLENLKMAFALAALHGVAVAGVRIASAPLWGRAVDSLGARPALIFCSFGIAFVPALWLLVTPEMLWPIALEAGLSGTLWAGHGIASMDLTLHSAPGDRRRPHYVAVFGATSGLGFAAASVLAGLLAVSLPARFELLGTPWMGLHVLFALSAVARAGAAVTALRIKERGARPVGTLIQVLASRLLATLAQSK